MKSDVYQKWITKINKKQIDTDAFCLLLKASSMSIDVSMLMCLTVLYLFSLYISNICLVSWNFSNFAFNVCLDYLHLLSSSIDSIRMLEIEKIGNSTIMQQIKYLFIIHLYTYNDCSKMIWIRHYCLFFNISKDDSCGLVYGIFLQ